MSFLKKLFQIGYGKDGFNQYGYNREGFDREGFDREGFDREGFDREGFDREGYNKDGYNRKGYHKNGFNQRGYNKYGYNYFGYNSSGFDQNGDHLLGFNLKSLTFFNHTDEFFTIYNKRKNTESAYSSKTKNKEPLTTPNPFAEFDAIRIGIASPEQILDWSHGEIKKPETINYRTLKPERDGLFCEKIFGPTKDWECHCGKYKKIRYKGKICDRCGVEVTRANVRRERMGHISLAAPVSHIWYFKGIPSRMGLLLDITPRILESVLYFKAYIVTNPSQTPLVRNQILYEKEYREMREKYEDDFEAGMGAEAVKKLLSDINLEELSTQLREELQTASGQKKARIVKRLEVVDAFLASGNRPEWMIIDVLPVIPPELRPMVTMDGGRFQTSDLNDLYRRVINRNNRLKRLIQLNAPDIIVRNQKRVLQEAVDALIDNGRRGRAVTGANNRALKSLSDQFRGKQGRFRQNLLGKRVDYSGCSAMVVGPELKIYQCGLPKEMAIELFRPFVMKKLVEDGLANNIKSAKKMVDRGRAEVWDALDFIIKEHPVMLNRAPSLHRLGVQAFEPVLVEGRAIRLPLLVYSAFNNHLFDENRGITVHVPLSPEAQAEARILMLSAHNLLNPQDSSPSMLPIQDMVLGSYYLTYERDEENDPAFTYTCVQDSLAALERREIEECTRIWIDGTSHDGHDRQIPTNAVMALRAQEEGGQPQEILHAYSSEVEARLAYNAGELDLHVPILVRMTRRVDGQLRHQLVRTTVGRLIFNEDIPQDLGFVDRQDPLKMFEPEINFVAGKKQLGKIIDKCISKHGFTVSANVLDIIKTRGCHYATLSGLTVSIYDMTMPAKKHELISETQKKTLNIEKKFKRGVLTNDERYRLVVDAWEQTTVAVTKALQQNLDRYNPIFMMADSGAAFSMAQIRQLAGMCGLITDTYGRAVEIPIKANFREGLSVWEYFISSRSARKGLIDNEHLRFDYFYLIRNIVDTAQKVVISELDCGTDEGITISEVSENGQVIENFGERLKGRFPVGAIVDPKTGEVLFTRDTMLQNEDAAVLEAHGILEVDIRSVLTCHARSGVCSKCYGMNLANLEVAGQGDAVGMIAAQSLGGSIYQLFMESEGHNATLGDGVIGNLLFRLEEVLQARSPKRMAQLAEVTGMVSLEENKRAALCNLTITAEDGEVVSYELPYSSGIRVKHGDIAKMGAQLTEGVLSPHDVLRISGVSAVYNYLIQEIQKAYRQQGVDINDKHIEIIVSQMMRKVRIEEAGDSKLLYNSMVEYMDFLDAKAEVKARIEAGETNDGVDLVLPVASRLLMGITKAALATESFLSAASLGEPTEVLTTAAIKGKVDHLVGLKENVIIGKLIPAGSGLAVYFDANG